MKGLINLNNHEYEKLFAEIEKLKFHNTSLLTLISSLPAYILSIIGFFISNINLGEMFKCIILSFSFGSLFYVLVIELLPQIIKQYKTKYSFLYILIGILLSSVFIFME